MLPFIEKRDLSIFTYQFEDFQFPHHIHEELEIIWVKCGEISLELDGKCYQLTLGQSAIIFPNQVHGYINNNASNNGYILLISQRCISDYLTRLKKYQPENPVFSMNEVHKDISYAYSVLLESSYANEDFQKAYANLLLCHAISNLNLVERQNGEDDVLYKLIEYMEENFKNNLTLTNTAEKLYLSKYQLSRIFSNRINMNFKEYLNRLRLEYVIQKMKTTEDNITVIALEAGFDSIRTFNRAFHKIYNMAPFNYRKKLKKI